MNHGHLGNPSLPEPRDVYILNNPESDLDGYVFRDYEHAKRWMSQPRSSDAVVQLWRARWRCCPRCKKSKYWERMELLDKEVDFKQGDQG
jgi:hypothetical protein